MIKNSIYLQNFENNLVRKNPSDYLRNQKILRSMYKEALALCIFPLKNPLDGIENDIKFAKAINSVPEINKKNRH